MGRDKGGSVLYDRLISNRAKFCGALISVPAGNQLLLAKNWPGSYTPVAPLVTTNSYLIYAHEIDEAFDELLD
jgi:hypothetical protein